VSSGLPYETPVLVVAMQGGQAHCFGIPFPSRVFIKKLIVTQVSGANDPFTVDLYNSSKACAGGSLSESQPHSTGPTDPGRAPPENYKVIPTQNNVGYAVELFQTSEGYVFFSHDKPHIPGQNERRLYVKITAQGVGPKRFAVSVGGVAGLV
jgi:hypothetical protein